MWKTFGSAAVTPLTKSYQAIQRGSSWVDTNWRCISESAVAGSWQRPAIDWCYNHEEAFMKMSFQSQNIQSLMDCSQLPTFISGQTVPSSSPSLLLNAWDDSMEGQSEVSLINNDASGTCLCARHAPCLSTAGDLQPYIRIPIQKICIPKVIIKTRHKTPVQCSAEQQWE